MIGLVWLLTGCGDKDDDNNTGTTDPAPVDADGDGFDTTEDCDDSDASINPDAEESCDDIDNDCDGNIDDGVTQTWYADADGDGYGSFEDITWDCEEPADHVQVSGDCDDSDAAVYPGAEELCDGIDNDCGGVADEGLTTTYYYDADGDGYGTENASAEACEAPDPGYIEQGGDCDDSDASIHPGAAEVCDDIDNDCSEATGVVTWMGRDTDEDVDVSDWFTGTAEALAEVIVIDAGTLSFCEGTFYTSLYLSNDVTLRSVYGAESAVLSGGGLGPVVTIDEAVSVTIEDLTVADGYGKSGAGLSVTGGGALSLLGAIVEGNVAEKMGGGLYVDTDSSAVGEGVTFSDNDPDDISRGGKKSYEADKKGDFACLSGTDACE